jgi:hypothetical protein
VAAYLKGVRSDDVHQAYKAAEAWLSRVHGRPMQTVATTSVDDEVTFELEPEHRQRLIAELAELEPELAAELGIRRRAS